MATKDTRSKELNTSSFWHLIIPVLFLLLLLFILFVVFTMPDWALDCPKGPTLVETLASKISVTK
jgi:hypothetical protein